jgi:membrane protein
MLLWSGLQGIGLRDLIRETAHEFMRHDMSTYSAALAFRSLLALFPFAIFLLGLVGALGQPEFFNWLLDQARVALPQDGFRSVEEVIAEVRAQSSGGLISIGIAVAVWAASVGVRSLMTALNVAYGVEESRPIWKVYPLSILYTVGLAVMLIVAAALMLIGPQALQWLAGFVGLEETFIELWAWLRWPAAVLLLLFAIAITYYVAPNVEQPFVLVTPGSTVAVVAWVAASFGFSFYVPTFGNYGATYGSLGGVIVLLLYFFISSAVLLIGAELNAVIYHFVRTGAPTVAEEPSQGKAALR